MNKEKEITLHVSGTHCKACKHLIEEALVEGEDITSATVDLATETLSVTTTRDEQDEEALASSLTNRLGKFGYSVHTKAQGATGSKNEWIIALAFVAVFVFGFFLLERVGLASRIGAGSATLTTALIVGLVASVSTCLAVVGGLVLSVSATYAHEGKGWRPQVLFHAGRLSGFFVLGGLLGVLGESVRIGFYGSTWLGIFVSIIMLVLGIQLLEVTKKVRVFTLPMFISQLLTAGANKTGVFAPMFMGVITFFLPCGFTQSMQLVSLSSGSFSTGAFTMFVFALGTLPVLATLSFGSLDLAKSRFRGIFFKTAGILVILFALFNLQNALAVFNIIQPIIHF